MMTEELNLMLNKFEAGTGKHPTKIICGGAAFEKLYREAIDDWGADRQLEPNPRDGYVGKFMGIPIQVIHNQNLLEDDKIYVLSEPEEELYNPVANTQWWVRKPANNLIIDDLVEDFRDYRVKRDDAFAARYYGQWFYNNAVTKHEEEVEIDDNALMSILNGGGYRAVA